MSNITTTTEAQVAARPHLEALLSKISPQRGRIIFALDATASREASWDTASKLTAEMFQAVAAAGGLDVQLVYFRGHDECSASRWFSDSKSLVSVMTKVMCRSGHTQIEKVLTHARKEHTSKKINAMIFIGDACEEIPADLYARARELKDVPVFMFQEGSDPHVAAIFSEVADITAGAYGKFDSGAAAHLGELLKAVAAFATGGMKALIGQDTEAAKLLLTQIKK